ncbi:MAG: response regulator, partial [Edaphobacter sp.]
GTLGENLIKARSAREALDHLLHNDIAVVLMDVSMPEIDGFELAEMMRRHPRFQKTAIIFISAVHLSGSAKESSRNTADQFASEAFRLPAATSPASRFSCLMWTSRKLSSHPPLTP